MADIAVRILVNNYKLLKTKTHTVSCLQGNSIVRIGKIKRGPHIAAIEGYIST